MPQDKIVKIDIVITGERESGKSTVLQDIERAINCRYSRVDKIPTTIDHQLILYAYGLMLHEAKFVHDE